MATRFQGRSKSKNNSMNSPVIKTPDSKKKTHVKRPLEDELIEDIDILSGKATNGTPQAKRPKLIEQLPEPIESEDSDLNSDDHDDDDNEVSDDEEEFDSNDEEDEDESDEESSDEEDQIVDKKPTKAIASPKSAQKPTINNVKMSPSKNVPTPVKDNQQMKSVLAIPHPPKDKNSLNACLSKFNVDASTGQTISIPITFIETDEATADEIAYKNLSVNGNALTLMHMRGLSKSVDQLMYGSITKTLFISGIPKSLQLTSLFTKIPSGIKVSSSRLLSHGAQNKNYNAAFVSFESANDAASAFAALTSIKFDEKSLRVVYSKDRSLESTAVNVLRNKTSSLIAEQLPLNVDESQLRSIFKTAIKFKIVPRKSETICFIEFSDPTAAAKAFDEHNSGRIGKGKLILRFIKQQPSNFALLISGFPPGTNAKQIEGLFPGASSSVPDAKGVKVFFPSEETRRRAIVGSKQIGGKTLNISIFGGPDGKSAFVRNIPYEATEDEIAKCLPGVESVKLIKRDGKALGMANVQFSSAKDYRKAIEGSFALRGRHLFVCEQAVQINQPQSNKVMNKEAKKEVEKAKKDDEKKVKPVKAASAPVPEQVGSSEDEEDEDEDDDESGSDEDIEMANGDVDSGESEEDEEDDEEEEEESDEEEPPAVMATKKAKKTAVPVPMETNSSEEDEDDDEDEEDDDEDEEDDDEDEEDDDEDVEMPEVDQKKQHSGNQKPWRGGGGKPDFGGRGARGGSPGNRGRGDFKPRGDFRGGNRGGGGFRGGNRGGSGNDGFRGGNRGGGFRGGNRGGGGSSFRGGNRGGGFRGGNRGGFRGGNRGGGGGFRGGRGQ